MDENTDAHFASGLGKKNSFTAVRLHEFYDRTGDSSDDQARESTT